MLTPKKYSVFPGTGPYLEKNNRKKGNMSIALSVSPCHLSLNKYSSMDDDNMEDKHGSNTSAAECTAD